MQDLRLATGGVKLGDVPEVISRLQRLTRLACDDCGVSALPSTISALTALQSLIVLENEWVPADLVSLEALPNEVAQLPSLKALSVTLAHCPPVAGALRHLECIEVTSVAGATEAHKWEAAVGEHLGHGQLVIYVPQGYKD